MEPPTGFVTYTWLIATTISLGGVLVVIFSYLLGAKANKGEVLLRVDHEAICKEAKKELVDAISDKLEGIKEHFDLQIENTVMKELRKLNGKQGG